MTGDRQELCIVTATFVDEGRGANALATLVSALPAADLGASAVVTRTGDGGVRFLETHDSTAKEGAILGAGFGALVGLVALLLGPIGLLGAPVGAGIGALVGRLRDSGFRDDELRALGTDLAPGSSAVICTINPEVLGSTRRLLEQVEADRVVVSRMGTDLATVLDAEAGTPPG